MNRRGTGFRTQSHRFDSIGVAMRSLEIFSTRDTPAGRLRVQTDGAQLLDVSTGTGGGRKYVWLDFEIDDLAAFLFTLQPS